MEKQKNEQQNEQQDQNDQNEQGCPMLNVIMPIVEPISNQPKGIKLKLLPCVKKNCRFWIDDIGICGIDLVIEAVIIEKQEQEGV